MASKKYKVIFDTNSIRNKKSLHTFLGGRPELEDFSKVSEIIIPNMAIDEIKNQKREYFELERDSFLDNPFRSLMEVNEAGVRNFNIEEFIEQLEINEQIPYSLISLTKNRQENMKSLSLLNSPPFDKNSDKGFKDAYIYFTVLEFLENNKDIEKVFLVTGDGRLKEAFENNPRVQVIKNYDEFEMYMDSYFKEEYFINRLNEEIPGNITAGCIENIWLNLDENWVIKLVCNGVTYYVEAGFSSREIFRHTDANFSTKIRALTRSGTFSYTHDCIKAIREYVQYFSDQDIQDLILAATTNDQIYQISHDSDVKIFFSRIFDAKSQIIPEDVRGQFKEKFQYDPDI